MWYSSSDGYTRGEGFAAIILKTLSQAVADGDHIECIIRETGVNSDGGRQVDFQFSICCHIMLTPP